MLSMPADSRGVMVLGSMGLSNTSSLEAMRCLKNQIFAYLK